MASVDARAAAPAARLLVRLVFNIDTTFPLTYCLLHGILFGYRSSGKPCLRLLEQGLCHGPILLHRGIAGTTCRWHSAGPG